MKSNLLLKITTLLCAVILFSCTDDKPTEVEQDPKKEEPTVKTFAFSPAADSVGQQIILYRKIFSQDLKNLQITFNGANATLDSSNIQDSIQRFYVRVPNNATSGKITVIADTISFESDKDFNVLPSSIPRIIKVSVKDNDADIQTVNFNLSEEPRVSFGEYNATEFQVADWADNFIRIIFPLNATSTDIRVYDRVSTQVLYGKLILPPVISSSTPSTGYPGSEVLIKGQWFGKNSASVKITFDKDSAKVLSVSPTEIKVRVPKGIIKRLVSVSVNGVSSKSNIEFTTTQFTIEPEEYKYCKVTVYSPSGDFTSYFYPNQGQSSSSNFKRKVEIQYESCGELFNFNSSLYSDTCAKVETIRNGPADSNYIQTMYDSKGMHFDISLSEKMLRKFTLNQNYFKRTNYYSSPAYMSNSANFAFENIPIIQNENGVIIAEAKGEILKNIVKLVTQGEKENTGLCHTCSTSGTFLKSLDISPETLVRIEIHY